VRELGYLPLAIEQASAYIRESSRNIDTFLPIYRISRSTLQSIHEWVPEGNRYYAHTLATPWDMSFNIIKYNTECPEALRLLQLLAFLNSDVILVDFLAAGAETLDSELSNMLRDTVQLDRGFAVLKRFSLIKQLRGVNGVSIHPLLQDAIQSKMTEEELLVWWETIAKMCLEAFPAQMINLETTLVGEWQSICHMYQDQVLIPLLRIPMWKSETLEMCLNRGISFHCWPLGPVHTVVLSVSQLLALLTDESERTSSPVSRDLGEFVMSWYDWCLGILGYLRVFLSLGSMVPMSRHLGLR
jgi:hypothetical protein